MRWAVRPDDEPDSWTTGEIPLPKLRVHNFTISLDGYGAGLDQSPQNLLGVGGERLHDWVVATHTFRTAHGQKGGEGGGIDDAFASRQLENIGAWIMGRNMFGPVRGPWPDELWRGWWSENPPFHSPVFVLTHHPRPPLTMQGGTTFHFVTDGIESALEQASEAAGGLDVLIGGGASTIQQYLRAGLIDEMHYCPESEVRSQIALTRPKIRSASAVHTKGRGLRL